MSLLNAKETANEFITASKTERCVICGKNTHVPIDLHIDLRSNYIEGAGQLCEACYKELYTRTKDKVSNDKAYIKIKRLIDFILSLCAIIVLSPIFLAIAILIKKEDKGPVFYKHMRIGKNGKPLPVFKFRSMTTKYKTFDEFYETLTEDQKQEWNENFKLTNDPRVTKIGKFLRKTSLDELPQIINILKGEMSIIGPRPIIGDELSKYGDRKDEFLSVLPGLTGYWAANGRSDTSYEERMEMELYYVNNISFSLDLKIFFKTIISVLKKEGAK